VGKLNASYRAAVKNAEIVAKLTGAGIDVLQSTPAEFSAYMRSETEKWEKVVKAANIRAD
jgi:tripartite-type tricarboxylate transporter receptor subunit TctC